jgi:hypothetical protein
MPNDRVVLRPDRPITDVASELRDRTGDRDEVLLLYLRKRNLTAYIDISVEGLVEIEIPTSVWIQFDAKKFKLVRQTKGRRRRYRLSIPAGFALEKGTSDLKRLIGKVFAKESAVFDAPELRRWVPSAVDLSADTHDWTKLHDAMITRLIEFAELAAKGAKALVYVTADEWDRFFQSIPAPKGAGGRPALESDRFWIELVAKFKPNAEAVAPKTMIQDLLNWSQKVDLNQPRSESWIKARVQMVFERLKKDADKNVKN